jgi:hypothetical protein
VRRRRCGELDCHAAAVTDCLHVRRARSGY